MANPFETYVNTELPLRPSAAIPEGGNFTAGMFMRTIGVGMTTVPAVVKFSDNIIIVSKTGGDFTEIQDAIDSIDDAAADNTYMVQVNPGTYTQRVTETKDYVYIVGTDPNLCVLAPTPITGSTDIFFKITNTDFKMYNIKIELLSFFPVDPLDVILVKLDVGYATIATFTNCLISGLIFGGAGCTFVGIKYGDVNQTVTLLESTVGTTLYDFVTANLNMIEMITTTGSSINVLTAERSKFYLGVIDAMTGSIIVDNNSYVNEAQPQIILDSCIQELQGSAFMTSYFTGTMNGLIALGTKSVWVLKRNQWKFYTYNATSAYGTAYAIYADPSSTGMIIHSKQNLCEKADIANSYYARLKTGVALNSIIDDYYDMSGKIDINSGTFNDRVAPYIPANGTYWADTDPATVKEAVDRLASAVYVLRGSSPIP